MATIGELTDIGVPDLIDVLSRRGRTGRLTVKAAGLEIQLYFQGGQLLSVTSSDLTLRLGRMLIRQGLLTAPRLLDALHVQTESGGGRPLGAILLDRGWVTDADLTRCIEEQSIEVVARVIDDQPGFFVFDPGVAPPSPVDAIPLAPDILLRAARERIDALQMLRKQLPEPATPLFLAESAGAALGTLDDLPAPEAMVVNALRGGAKTLSELSCQMALDELTLGVTILGLCERGIVATSTGRHGGRRRQLAGTPAR